MQWGLSGISAAEAGKRHGEGQPSHLRGTGQRSHVWKIEAMSVSCGLLPSRYSQSGLIETLLYCSYQPPPPIADRPLSADAKQWRVLLYMTLDTWTEHDLQLWEQVTHLTQLWVMLSTEKNTFISLSKYPALSPQAIRTCVFPFCHMISLHATHKSYTFTESRWFGLIYVMCDFILLQKLAASLSFVLIIITKKIDFLVDSHCLFFVITWLEIRLYIT